jgi:DNA-binding transcriptional LysR family regulator
MQRRYAIRAFRRRHPHVALAFVDGNAAELTDAVQERRVHVALVRAPVARPAGLRQESLLEEPLLVAIARSHPLFARRRTTIALADLREEAFILVRRPGAPGMYGDLVAACRRAGFDPRIAAEVGNMFVNTMLVAAEVGVSVVPASMAQSYARGRVHSDSRCARAGGAAYGGIPGRGEQSSRAGVSRAGARARGTREKKTGSESPTPQGAQVDISRARARSAAL